MQPYATPGSTESRILITTGLKAKNYDINEYGNKFCYFNRVLRPSYYTEQIIKDNNYFDHCYDCTFFSYIMKEYLDKFDKFSKKIFKSDDVLSAMYVIKDKLEHIERTKYVTFVKKLQKFNQDW